MIGVKMYYTIYKITNTVNNKFYIGKHQTDDLDDGYMGSGFVLKRAIEKYGLDKFVKEILYVFDNEEQMNNMEKEIVNEEFLLKEEVYNLQEGGHGSWFYANFNHLSPMFKDSPYAFTDAERRLHCKKYGEIGRQHFQNKLKSDIIYYEKYCKKLSESKQNYYTTHSGTFKNKKHSKETKEKIGMANSAHQQGNKNSQYGTCWIYNENIKQNKNIKKEELENWLKTGWKKGRKMQWQNTEH